MKKMSFDGHENNTLLIFSLLNYSLAWEPFCQLTGKNISRQEISLVMLIILRIRTSNKNLGFCHNSLFHDKCLVYCLLYIACEAKHSFEFPFDHHHSKKFAIQMHSSALLHLNQCICTFALYFQMKCTFEGESKEYPFVSLSKVLKVVLAKLC